MSVVPPAANGTMNLTGLCGQPCADAPVASKAQSRKPRVLRNLMTPPSPTILQRQGKRKADRDRQRDRRRSEALLPIAPGKEFEREDAQPAAEVRGERHDDAPLGELDETPLGPGQEGIEPQGIAERPEVQRQEQS